MAYKGGFKWFKKTGGTLLGKPCRRKSSSKSKKVSSVSPGGEANIKGTEATAVVKSGNPGEKPPLFMVVHPLDVNKRQTEKNRKHDA